MHRVRTCNPVSIQICISYLFVTQILPLDYILDYMKINEYKRDSAEPLIRQAMLPNNRNARIRGGVG